MTLCVRIASTDRQMGGEKEIPDSEDMMEATQASSIIKSIDTIKNNNVLDQQTEVDSSNQVDSRQTVAVSGEKTKLSQSDVTATALKMKKTGKQPSTSGKVKKQKKIG